MAAALSRRRRVVVADPSSAAQGPAAGPRRPLPAKLSVAAALSALGLLASACLSSGLTYVSHRSSDGVELYFTVPAKWRLFSAKQIIEAQNGPLSQTQINQIVAGQWLDYFAGSNHVTVKQLPQIGAKYPSGFAFARQLGASERDSLSFSQMRSAVLGSDPLSSSGFNVLSYSDYTAAGGVRGIRLVTDVQGSAGVTDTFAENIDVDASTNWLFGISIACRASCWGPNASTIDSILRSWTVKELPR